MNARTTRKTASGTYLYLIPKEPTMTENDFDEAQQERPHSAFESLWYGTLYGSAVMIVIYLGYLLCQNWPVR